MPAPGSRTFDVVIHLRNADAATPSTAIGLALAQRLQAWTVGLHVVPLSPVAFASPEAIALYSSEMDSLYRTATNWSPHWLSLLDRHGLAGEWQVTQGDIVESLCHASRWCDLLVVERPQLAPDAPTGWGVVSRTVFGASTPVVVVPESARAGTIGERIVVAWNESREAMLALRGALPLLMRAEQLCILEGDRVESPFGARYLPPFDLRAWLARHRIEAEFQAFTGGKERGAALLETAREKGADLIVMGAWGHSRITELVLGGATRHLFQHSDIPLLVAH